MKEDIRRIILALGADVCGLHVLINKLFDIERRLTS